LERLGIEVSRRYVAADLCFFCVEAGRILPEERELAERRAPDPVRPTWFYRRK
jgi:hypothetical protein